MRRCQMGLVITTVDASNFIEVDLITARLRAYLEPTRFDGVQPRVNDRVVVDTDSNPPVVVWALEDPR